MSQLLGKQYHMPLESTKPFTIINRPCLRVFIIITLQGGPMQNINLLFKCFKANYKKSYFCNVACWLKIKKTEKDIFCGMWRQLSCDKQATILHEMSI